VAPAPPMMAYSAAMDVGRGALLESAPAGGGWNDAPAISVRQMNVSSSGNITATFAVPGFMTVPSDDVAHNVTIAKLGLDAKMTWVSVPKLDTKVHLNVCIIFILLQETN